MRKLVLRVFDYSLDGIIGEDDTEFSAFCREVPDDQELEAWTIAAMERADVHIMGRGPSLFADLDRSRALELVSATAFGNQMAGLVYRRPR